MTPQLASVNRPLERGGTLTRIVVAIFSTLLLLTMLVPTLASPAKAQAVPGTRGIEIFHNREMVSIVGYDPGTSVMIEVIRDGTTVGAVTRTVFPDGTYEINHTGAGANDCWGPGVEGRDDPVDPQHPNVTPDIKPGDMVRTTILSGPNEGQVNSAVTRDVYLDFDKLVADEGDPDVDGDGTVTVQGHVRSTEAAPINFDQGDVVGIGLRKENRDSPWGDGQDGRKVLGADLTAADIGQDGNFTYTFRDIVEEDVEDVQTNGVSQSIEWTPAVVEPNEPPELTVYDASEGALPGCPPVEGAGPVEEPTPNVNQDLSPEYLSPGANLSAPVEEGRTMEVVYGIEFMVLEGYPANRDVRVDVVRGQGQNAVVVGSTTQRTDSTGLMEINHLGGGLFPGGDCWDYPGTPDIRPGDTVMATVLSPNGTPATDANNNPDVDTIVVRDVFLDTEETVVNDPTPGVEGDATISLQGHVRDLPNGQVDEAADVLELRLNANGFDWQSGDRPGRKDMRAQVTDISADGSYTHVFQVTDEDARNADSFGFEQGLEWSPAFVEPAEPGEIVVYNGSDLEGVGCAPHLGGTPADTVANAITGSSHKYVNSANQDQGQIVLSGVSYGKDQVEVSVAGTVATATPTPVDGAAPNGLQTWRTTHEVDLGALPQGEFQASATFVDSQAAATDPIATDTADMMKDVDGPAAPTTTLNTNVTYNNAQRVPLSAGDGDKVYYSTSGASENVTDALYTSPILVNESQTITAVAVDKAGNVSEQASFSYTIEPPVNARPTITGMTPADGTTVRNKRSTVAATVSDAETNLSRNDIRLTIRGEEIRTFSYNRTTDSLTYTPRKNFSVGATPVRIVATDAHGGRTAVNWTFIVRR